MGYSYFQAYKIKKYISENVSGDKSGKASDLSIAKISISDFPISRKVKLNDIKIKHSDGLISIASAKIKIKPLDNNLTVEDVNLVTISDQNGNVENFIETKPDMVLNFFLDEKKDYGQLKIINLGFKILDKNKKPLFDIQSKDSEMVTTLEKENFHYSNRSAEYAIHNLIDDTLFSGNSSSVKIDFTKNGDAGNAKVDLNFSGLKIVEKGKVTSDNKNSNFALLAEVNFTPKTTENKAANLTPQQNENSYKKPFEYLWLLDLKNLSIATTGYKITSSGTVSTSADDILPTAQVVLKIENFDSLISDITQMLENLTKEANKKSLDANATPSNKAKLEQASEMAMMATGFIQPFSEVAKSAAAKNTLSKNNLLVFEFRREKGQELLINNSSLDELMTNYMQIMQSKMPQSPQDLGYTNQIAPVPNQAIGRNY